MKATKLGLTRLVQMRDGLEAAVVPRRHAGRDDAVETVRATVAGKAAGGRKRGRRCRCCARTEAWAPATARTCVVSSNSKSLLKKIFPKVFIGRSTKNSFPQNYIIPQQISNKKLPNISKLTTSSRGPPCWAPLRHTGSI